MSYTSDTTEHTVHTEAEPGREVTAVPAVEEGAVAEAVVDERAEPVTDPDAWHFTKGEVVALVEHIKEWVRWNAKHGDDPKPEPEHEPVVEHEPAREA